ncbi:MAG: hypothetical protein P8L30_01210 [Longimicrobiales bacterium]|nr:hypothetical protein [Longimicrobiales bacterium]
MTIRIQNLLVIPPIFLILGLAVGLLADTAVQEEIIWGLEEEAVAMAVTVAEMTGLTTLDRVVAGDAEATERLRSQLQGVARHGLAQSIVLYSRGQGRAVLALHRDSTATDMEQPLWDRQLSGISGQTVLGAVGDWGPYSESLAAAAPIQALGGEADGGGVALVVVGASRLTSLTAELRSRLMTMVLLLTSIGAAAALFLSRQVGRQVRELARVGAQVAAGRYESNVQVSGVTEVQDLSNTLGTMASILSDVFSRGRRALLIGDPFHLNRQTAAAYRDSREVQRPQPEGIQVEVSHIGEAPPGCFYGWGEVGDQVALWVGEMAGGRALDLAVEAATANRMIDRGLSYESPDEVSRSVSRLFDFNSLQFAIYSREATDEPQCLVLQGSGSLVQKGEYSVIHSFQSEHMDTLAGSLSLFRDLPLDQASREIPYALPDDLAGVLLLIRPSRPHDQEVSS